MMAFSFWHPILVIQASPKNLGSLAGGSESTLLERRRAAAAAAQSNSAGPWLFHANEQPPQATCVRLKACGHISPGLRTGIGTSL